MGKFFFWRSFSDSTPRSVWDSGEFCDESTPGQAQETRVG
ncbi:hypothetical protein FM120_28620 [Sphingobacterium faecium PCAi_F2.5]|nr:hypothetical protein FM120_28620 [Sphingobacterium faecium PCAi_F2.5]